MKSALARQREHEARAAPELSASTSVAAHALGQLAADRQAEPEAALRAGGRAAVEALEDVLALLGRDARAAVGDRRASPWRSSRSTLHTHRLAGRPVAQRVVEQDAHDARDRVGVAAAPAAARRAGRRRSRRRARARAARTRRPPRARSRRARPARSAAGTAASRRERSSSSLGQRRQPAQLAPRVGDLLAGRRSRSTRRRAGPRRAAPSCPGASSAACAARATRWRRTSAARPPGGAAPPACAPSARARSPTSSRPVVARRGRVRALPG